MSSSRTPDFARLAERYDELRNAGEFWPELVERVVEEADLRGRRVLDIGAGTGKWATVLAERYGCKVWGIDASPEMLEVARKRAPESVGLRTGRAERLPFKDEWFERVVMSLVLHLTDRRKALTEAHRVLEPGGVLAVVTFDYEHFEQYLLAPYFPSFEVRDKERFPDARDLEQELLAAGFESPRLTRFSQREQVSRESLLARIRGRHISTFQLIDDEEYRAGLERAERELPETAENRLEWLLARATRG
jgi:ubiquinone/menaquinone biosynthesis C-methylase UbiE